MPVLITGYLIELETPAVPITFSTSRYIQKFAEAELANCSVPKSASRASKVGSAKAGWFANLRIARISVGVFAGAPIPTQLIAS
jgi:hypothetical protein